MSSSPPQMLMADDEFQVCATGHRASPPSAKQCPESAPPAGASVSPASLLRVQPSDGRPAVDEAPTAGLTMRVPKVEAGVLGNTPPTSPGRDDHKLAIVMQDMVPDELFAADASAERPPAKAPTVDRRRDSDARLQNATNAFRAKRTIDVERRSSSANDRSGSSVATDEDVDIMNDDTTDDAPPTMNGVHLPLRYGGKQMPSECGRTDERTDDDEYDDEDDEDDDEEDESPSVSSESDSVDEDVDLVGPARRPDEPPAEPIVIAPPASSSSESAPVRSPVVPKQERRASVEASAEPTADSIGGPSDDLARSTPDNTTDHEDDDMELEPPVDVPLAPPLGQRSAATPTQLRSCASDEDVDVDVENDINIIASGSNGPPAMNGFAMDVESSASTSDDDVDVENAHPMVGRPQQQRSDAPQRFLAPIGQHRNALNGTGRPTGPATAVDSGSCLMSPSSFRSTDDMKQYLRQHLQYSDMSRLFQQSTAATADVGTGSAGVPGIGGAAAGRTPSSGSQMGDYAQYLGLQPLVKIKCFKCGDTSATSLAELKRHQIVCLREHLTRPAPLATALRQPSESSGAIDSADATAMAEERPPFRIRTNDDGGAPFGGGSSTASAPSTALAQQQMLLRAMLPPDGAGEPLDEKARLTRQVYLCSSCGSYYEKWNLFQHMLNVHRKFACLHCLGLFPGAERLMQHLEGKHGVRPEVFENREQLLDAVGTSSCFMMCAVCEHLFDEQDDFTNHSCEHFVKPCTACGLMFIHKPHCPSAAASASDSRRRRKHARHDKRARSKRPKRSHDGSVVHLADASSQPATTLPNGVDGDAALVSPGGLGASATPTNHTGNNLSSTSAFNRFNGSGFPLNFSDMFAQRALLNGTTFLQPPTLTELPQTLLASEPEAPSDSSQSTRSQRPSIGGRASLPSPATSQPLPPPIVISTEAPMIGTQPPQQSMSIFEQVKQMQSMPLEMPRVILTEREGSNSHVVPFLDLPDVTAPKPPPSVASSSVQSTSLGNSFAQAFATTNEMMPSRPSLVSPISSLAPSQIHSASLGKSLNYTQANATGSSASLDDDNDAESQSSQESPVASNAIVRPAHPPVVSKGKSMEMAQALAGECTADEDEPPAQRLVPKLKLKLGMNFRSQAPVESEESSTESDRSDEEPDDDDDELNKSQSPDRLAEQSPGNRTPSHLHRSLAESDMPVDVERTSDTANDEANAAIAPESLPAAIEADKTVVAPSMTPQRTDTANEEEEDVDVEDHDRDSINGLPEATEQQLASDESTDQLQLATDDVPLLDMFLPAALDALSVRDVLRACLRHAYPHCLYCNHARRIAVNGQQLARHLLSRHRFRAAVERTQPPLEYPNAVISEHLLGRLDTLHDVHFNLDTYDSTDEPNNRVAPKSFECLQCRFQARHHKDLYLHNRKMHMKTVVVCEMCKTNFYSFSELSGHVCPGQLVAGTDAHAPPADMVFRCALCPLDRLPSAFRLMVHLRKKHGACDICLEPCADQGRLSAHVCKHKLHHLCYRCGIAYRNKADITKHLFWKHGTESQQCKRCLQKKWPHVYHFCVPPATFGCELCGLQFKRAVALKVHRRLHQDNQPYPCTEDGCERKFISRKLLLKHVARHYPAEEAPPADVDASQATGVDGVAPISADQIKQERLDETAKVAPEAADIAAAVAIAATAEPPTPKPLIDIITALPTPNLSESDSSDESDDERATPAPKRAATPPAPNSRSSVSPAKDAEPAQPDVANRDAEAPDDLAANADAKPTSDALTKDEPANGENGDKSKSPAAAAENPATEPDGVPADAPDDSGSDHVANIWDNFKSYQAQKEIQSSGNRSSAAANKPPDVAAAQPIDDVAKSDDACAKADDAAAKADDAAAKADEAAANADDATGKAGLTAPTGDDASAAKPEFVFKRPRPPAGIVHVVQSDHDYCVMFPPNGQPPSEPAACGDETTVPAAVASDADLAYEPEDVQQPEIAADDVLAEAAQQSLLRPELKERAAAAQKAAAAVVAAKAAAASAAKSRPASPAKPAGVVASATAPTSPNDSDSPKKGRSPKKALDLSSDSSDSSSGSDSSSSCACKSKCNCSSSSSSSSSSGDDSSSSSSSSSASSSASRRKHRKHKSDRKSGGAVEAAANAAPTAEAQPVDDPAGQPPNDPDLLIGESDLETDESDTDEEFYDEHPQRLANQLLAEKRAQLLLRQPGDGLAAIVENSRPSTPSLPPAEDIGTDCGRRTKLKKRKKLRKGAKAAVRPIITDADRILADIPLPQHQQQPPVSAIPRHMLNGAQQPGEQPPLAAAKPRPVGRPPKYGPRQPATVARLSTGSLTSCGSDDPATAVAADGVTPLKRSKRRRIPNRFYGYTSDEDTTTTPSAGHHGGGGLASLAQSLALADEFRPEPAPPSFAWNSGHYQQQQPTDVPKTPSPPPAQPFQPPLKTVIKLGAAGGVSTPTIVSTHTPIPPLIIRPNRHQQQQSSSIGSPASSGHADTSASSDSSDSSDDDDDGMAAPAVATAATVYPSEPHHQQAAFGHTQAQPPPQQPLIQHPPAAVRPKVPLTFGVASTGGLAIRNSNAPRGRFAPLQPIVEPGSRKRASKGSVAAASKAKRQARSHLPRTPAIPARFLTASSPPAHPSVRNASSAASSPSSGPSTPAPFQRPAVSQLQMLTQQPPQQRLNSTPAGIRTALAATPVFAPVPAPPKPAALSVADVSDQIRFPIMPPAGCRAAQPGESVYCYCRCPYDEVSEMIACDGDDCPIEWFHFECVNIMVPPKGTWYCPQCRPKYPPTAAGDDESGPPPNGAVAS